MWVPALPYYYLKLGTFLGVLTFLFSLSLLVLDYGLEKVMCTV